MRQEVTRARNANRLARRALQQLLDVQEPSRQMLAILIAKTANALAECQDALNEVQMILQEVRDDNDRDE